MITSASLQIQWSRPRSGVRSLTLLEQRFEFGKRLAIPAAAGGACEVDQLAELDYQTLKSLERDYLAGRLQRLVPASTGDLADQVEVTQ